MIVAAAVCPYPPMLVPEVNAGADDLAALRQSCDDAIEALLAHEPERVVVIGAGDLTTDLDESAGGTFAELGVDLHVGGHTDELPLSLTVGAWLLARAGWVGPRTYSTGTPGTEGRVAVLVMADGSAKRTTESPGYFDERAVAYDDSIATALGTGDAAALAALDLDLAKELWAAGAPALRTLGEMAKGTTISALLRESVAPFGVGYWVADWSLS
ncbi:class III extradiol dioxygenase subunit B-like domain-containing protein [Aeromicrobium panaciterrae]|uniref:hypothetical protein n=1 Tax=Aeromicrobium panaciterrae TaxID=363861 RepID=UPI0031E27D90